MIGWDLPDPYAPDLIIEKEKDKKRKAEGVKMMGTIPGTPYLITFI